MKPTASRLIAGVLVVAALLFGGRWISYIGFRQVYVTDVLLALAAFHLAVTLRRSHQRAERLTVRSFHPLLALLIFWATVRLLMGDGEFAVVALRDYAPYFYAVAGIIAGVSYSHSTMDARSRTARWLWVALVGHLLWVTLAWMAPAVLAGMPTIGGSALFRVRVDFDSSVVGATAAIALVCAFQPGRRRWAFGGVAAWAYVLTLAMASRAGLLAALAATLLAIVAIAASGSMKQSRKLLLAGLLPMVVLVAVAVIPLTAGGEKLLAGFGVDPLGTRLGTTPAMSTQEARSSAWGQVIDYVASEGATVEGVGFGPNFLLDSGAVVSLVHTDREDVRSPHNFFIGTYARLGLVGLTLVTAIVVVGVGRIVKMRRSLASDRLLMTCALLFVGLIPAAAVGVILEAPFGAVPFYWAAGVLLVAATPSESTRLLSQGSRTVRPRLPARTQ